MKHFKVKVRKTCKRITAFAVAVMMLVVMLPVGLLSASAAVIPNSQWSTSGTTLKIENAADLWAFATALNNGNDFLGQTILLENDIIVNEGWDAFSNETPTGAKYPLTATGKTFAGTFDGQGYTISGLYLETKGYGVGFFGNVARATMPTVKNLTIVNSAIQNKNGSVVGGIFGDIYAESDTVITDDNYVNKTKATIDNVHLDINITAGGQYSGSSNGVGGFVGRNRADVSIINSSIDGTITTASRGVAAFVGAVYPNQIDGYDHDSNSATDTVSRRVHFTHTRIENCVNMATVDVSASEAIRFAGALVGYSNSNTDQYEIRNVFSLGRMIGTSASSNPIGYLFGGTWCSANNYRNGTTMDYQTWMLENVYYEALPEYSYTAFEKTTDGMKINGEPTAIASCDLEKYFASSMRQNLAIKNDLAMNILVNVVDRDAVVTINDMEVSPTSVNGWERIYTLDGILPQSLRDPIAVKVTQTFGDRTVVSEQTTSVYRYLQNLWRMEQVTKAERDLIADLLRYGEQAQIFKNYKTDTVATYGFALDGYGSSYDVASIPTQYAVSGTENADYNINAVSLLLDNSPSLWFKLKATDTTDLTVKITVNGRERIFAAAELDRYGAEYVVSFDGIGAHEMNATITAALYKSGAQVGTSLTYSLADYVKDLLSMDSAGNDELAAYQTLVAKMYAYGLSAEAYNDSNRQVIDAEYVIVYDNSASDTIKAAAQEFAVALKAKTGLSLRVVADTTAAQDKEILIGNMDGRDESNDEKAKITANRGNGYRVTLSGQKLVICGNDYLIEYAAEHVVKTIRLHGGSTWSLPLGYTEIVDVPTITTPSGSTLNIQYAENGNYSWSLKGGSELSTTYSAYQTQLMAVGFKVYATNTIGNNTFTTYIHTENGYNTAVHAAYYPNTQNVRITYGPIGYLPGTEKIDASEVGVSVTPSIILNARATAYAGASGMSLMLQLVDGSFIIIDGGNPDQVLSTWTKESGEWVKNEAAMTEDAKHMYELLDELTPGDAKPRVAAWIITHAHGDHIGMANQFVKSYHAHVDVDMVAYNFPDFDTVTITKESAASMDSLADTFVSQMKTYYPNAPHWVMHTGQTQYLPGCEIEVFYTPEDYYGNSSTADTFPWGNQTAIAFRITLGDTTMMVLGDCEADLCLQMANNYKEALESDILQVTHHGSNGANYSFYSYIDPKICIWPIDRHNFETGASQLGSASASQTDISSHLYANWWLRNTVWTRSDGTSGNRTHYAVEEDVDSRLLYPVNNDFIIVTPGLKF